MVDLSAFSLKDIQNMLAMLGVVKGSGVDDVALAIKLLEAAIKKELGKFKETLGKRKNLPICPSCKKGVLVPVMAGGVKVVGCRICRYSEIVYPGGLLR